MPMLTRECLALKFRQNWMARHPVDPPVAQVQPLDDSLTSLSWLQNLNIMKMASPTPPSSPTPPETPSTSSQISLSQQSMPLTINPMDLRVNPNAVLNMTNLPTVKTDSSMFRSMGGVEVHPPQTNSPGVVDKIDYKTNPYVKPPYSYATLICMAMKESKKNKITLAGIYNWITDNFMYYRVADPSWQNSIRHNLSLNKCFQKVPRRKDEPGKGGFWRINPEYSDMFVNGIFKKRRNSARENIAPVPMKRARRDDDVSCENPAKQFRGMQIKTEPQEDRILHLNDEFSDTLTGDFNWSAILHQDIEVGGVSVKTEDLIDTHEDSVSDNIASPITALSPPPSDSNSDVALEDLFVTDQDAALDLSSSVDLTVQGFTIKPPDWWSESMTRGLLSPMENHSSNSGLNTPISASPVPDHHPISHPWAEDRTDLDEAIASFDLDLQNLFEEDSLISNPSCLLDS